MVPNEMDAGSEANISNLNTSVAEFAAAVKDSMRLSDGRVSRLEDRVAKLAEAHAATDK